eukprot:TRINITY_DN13569_c0_g1_i1.p1 TRINITY_DN13569_c0_g1~~TRINITY_DN13569_c0_g1_i1.p1  ORF type:complete len:741 (-),score=140.07 TRINITY_DN13569_c0_g1_i1:129-2351(-)
MSLLTVPTGGVGVAVAKPAPPPGNPTATAAKVFAVAKPAPPPGNLAPTVTPVMASASYGSRESTGAADDGDGQVGWRRDLDVGHKVLVWRPGVGGARRGTWQRGTVMQTGDRNVAIEMLSAGRQVFGRGSLDIQPVIEQRGVTLDQLKRFVEDCKAECQSGRVKDPREFVEDANGEQRSNPNYHMALNFDEAPTWLVVDLFIKPKTQAQRVPFVDTMARRWPNLGGPRRAQHFISHAWAGSFSAVVRALERYSGDSGLWFACFALTQDSDRFEVTGNGEEPFNEVFRSPDTTSHVLVLHEGSSALRRKWVLFELLRGKQARKRLSLLSTHSLEDVRWSTLEWQKAQCTVFTDAEYIDRQVSQQPGGVGFVMESVVGVLLSALSNAVEAAQLDHGDSHPKVADVRVHRGIFLQALKRTSECVTEYQAAVKIRAIRLGDDLSVASLRHRLGNIYRDQGQLKDARFEYEDEIRLMVMHHGQMNQEVAHLRNNLGVVLQQLDEPFAAESQFRQAIEIRIACNGTSHQSLVNTRGNLAAVLVQQKKIDQAREEYEAMLKVAVQSYGPEHGTVAEAKNGLGSIYQMTADPEKAQTEYEGALKIRIALFGENHACVGETRNNLGTVLARQRKFEEALVQYNDALRIKVAMLGEDHPSVADTRNNLGLCFSQQRLVPEASNQFEKALRIRTQSFGEDHPLVAETQANLSQLLAPRRSDMCAWCSSPGNLGKTEHLIEAVHQEDSAIIA